ncbi:MAG: sigma-70 family RNA polymerase sigma factor, partial [Deltaproteobacteria bacterium]|nr:sigma-70 family RNA polymerase sigma factor [Deltaproteobacteria bacterium]
MTLRPDDLRSVYEACAHVAFRRARGLLGSDADAWDVVHEVFCALAQEGSLGRIEGKVLTYVYRATTNACLNELRARRMRERKVPGADNAPEVDRVHARDLLDKLDVKLDDLDRRIVVMWFHDELPQEQIAEVLGVWRRTVGRRLTRLRKLVEELEGVSAAPVEGAL